MKPMEHKRALELRRQGLTYKEIGQQLGVSKSTLNNWLKAVPYKPSNESLKRGRLARIQNAQVLHKRKIKRVSKIMEAAGKDIESLSTHSLKLIGLMAYWCEGSKTADNIVKFTNSDSELIRLMAKWFTSICRVSLQKMRVHLRVHEDVSIAEAKEYWSGVTGVPLTQFHRTTIKRSESGGKRANKLPYGIASIIVCDTDLFYRIKGWTKALANKLSD